MKKAISLLSTMLLCTSVYAADVKCPKIDLIKSIGIQAVEKDQQTKQYFGYHMDNYETDNLWTFAVGLIKAKSSDKAMEKVNDILNAMHAEGVYQQNGPIPGCFYETGMPNTLAFAVRDVDMPEVKQMMRAIP